jgi:RNA polymerase sigma-70 factor (ECF subfamily)
MSVTRSEPSMTELAELVAAAREGDSDAFGKVVEATYAETFTLARRLCGNEEDARDVAQEAYLRAFKGLRRFRGDAQFTTWMYRITANAAATHLTKRNRHRHDELTDEMSIADERPELDPVARAEASSLRAEVADALDEMPENLRSVVVLRDVYGMSHAAIAAELGISETNAKVRLHRARRHLRSRIFPNRGEERHARAV